MKNKVFISLIVSAGALSGSMNSAFAAQETTPQNMTCQEFINMNPKYMTPIAFWVVNKDTDFKGGDYVHWQEVETVSVPRIYKQCQKTPKAKLGELTHSIK
ncbi:acid-activated periplasmic chaperone HdeB [Buttiauxella sp. WJP83]|uniref:acid-activated periplasmic chaperone HdeB n=1 Tax=Buttiauxella sp. WJP83 TaxID=2986951 RepID=UPI003FA42C19